MNFKNLLFLLILVSFSNLTLAQTDTDGDGVNDSVDLDDDNDGILDKIELPNNFIQITPADLGLSNNTSGNSGNSDISALFGLPAGDVSIFYSNVFVANSGRFEFLINDPATQGQFTIFSTIPLLARPRIGGSMSGDAINVFEVFTSNTYTFTGSLNTGITHTFDPVNNTYTLENTTSSNVGGNQFQWTSDNLYDTFQFTFRSPANGVSTDDGFYFLEFKRPLDTDSDGIFDHLDTDSDGDGCSDANEYYENGNADGNADGTDNLEYGTGTGSSIVNSDGEVIVAGYNGTALGLTDAQDNAIGDACVFIQTVDGNFSNSSSWRENAVPTFNNNATIDNNVLSTVTQNDQVRNLVTNPGSEVSINSGFELFIKEDLTNNGDFTGDGYVVFDGTVAQQIIGDGTDAGSFSNIRVNKSTNNVTLTDDAEITGILDIDDGDFIIQNY